MPISVMDEDVWGESVERYQWSDSGAELLLQLTESLRVYAVNGAVTERSVIPVELGEVLGIGCSSDAWWVLTKQGDVAAYRQGLEGRDPPLEGSVAPETSSPTVSPDGRVSAQLGGRFRSGRQLFGFPAKMLPEPRISPSMRNSSEPLLLKGASSK